MSAPGREQGRTNASPGGAIGRVGDWMSHRPVTASLDQPVRHVIGLMATHGIRHVPITDGKRLVGIVSNRDLRTLLVEGERPPTPDAPVSRLMTDNPVTVSPEVSLIEAARAMLERKIGALPVVDGDRIVGILTKSDALEALLAWADRPPPPRSAR